MSASLRSVYPQGRDLREARSIGRPDAWRCDRGAFYAGWMGIGSAYDLQPRQSLLKFLYSRIGDFRAGKVQFRETDQAL